MALVFGCGRCNAPLRGPREPNANSTLACPDCGKRDTFENVQRIIGEFFEQSGVNEVAHSLRRIASNSEFAIETARPNRVYDFIAWDDGSKNF